MLDKNDSSFVYNLIWKLAVNVYDLHREKKHQRLSLKSKTFQASKKNQANSHAQSLIHRLSPTTTLTCVRFSSDRALFFIMSRGRGELKVNAQTEIRLKRYAQLPLSLSRRLIITQTTVTHRAEREFASMARGTTKFRLDAL